MGAWMLRPPPAIEVAVTRGSSRLRADAGVVLHWEPAGNGGSASVVSLQDALFRVILDHDLEVAVPCVDWALHSGRMGRIGFERLLLMLPRTARCIREWVDPASQSVLESVARVRLVRRGWRVRSQVRVGDLDAIDLVVNDQVAIELDGREHHESSFLRDRRKDLQIAIEGRHCLRASYAMVVDEWPELEAAIGEALRRRGIAHNSVIRIPEPRGHRHGAHASRLND
jgi:very-short-patch-repair endonuclease